MRIFIFALLVVGTVFFSFNGLSHLTQHTGGVMQWGTVAGNVSVGYDLYWNTKTDGYNVLHPGVSSHCYAQRTEIIDSNTPPNTRKKETASAYARVNSQEFDLVLVSDIDSILGGGSFEQHIIPEGGYVLVTEILFYPAQGNPMVVKTGKNSTGRDNIPEYTGTVNYEDRVSGEMENVVGDNHLGAKALAVIINNAFHFNSQVIYERFKFDSTNHAASSSASI